jgi:hypothetical protein
VAVDPRGGTVERAAGGARVGCSAGRVRVLVTDVEVPAAVLEPWREAGVEILRV